jgi:hypothetical protein
MSSALICSFGGAFLKEDFCHGGLGVTAWISHVVALYLCFPSGWLFCWLWRKDILRGDLGFFLWMEVGG